jgi:hypothetical protein
LHRRIEGAPAVATHAAEPCPGALGPAAFRPDGLGPIGGAVPVPAWEGGDANAVREAHRLGWFAELARRAANGDTAAGEAAAAGLASWLRHDVPGRGPGWEHGSDLAVRVVHLAAGFAWLGAAPSADLRAAASGSVGWHLRQLRARLPVGVDDAHRRVAHLAGLVVGGLAFPAAPGARSAWSEGASALGPALSRLGHADGSDPFGAPAFLEQSLWLAAVAIAVARASGAALPDAGTAAWARGVRYLDRLANDDGAVPPLGEAPFGTVLAAPGVKLPASLRNLAVGWGLDGGDPAPGPDARAAWFGLSAGPPAAPAARVWAAWSFGGAGTAVAALQVRGECMRVVLAGGGRDRGPLAHAAPLQLLVDVGGLSLLGDPGPGVRDRGAHDGLVVRGEPGGDPVLDVARVDGKRVRLEGHQALGRGVRWERAVLLNQQRVRVTDRLRGRGGAVSLRWTLGAGWEVEGADRAWKLRSARQSVVIELPDGLRWRFEPGAVPAFVGEGELAVDAAVTSSFEVR